MMRSLLGRPDPDPGAGPGGGRWGKPEDRRDILQEDRERRVRRRRLWYLWPGNLLSGKFGMAVLALFLVGGLGWVLYSNISGAIEDRFPEEAPAAAVHPDAGRALTAGEYTLAAFFGEPLYLGDGGLPVIRVPATGDVREVTPVEVAYDEPVPFVHSGFKRAMWGPGPRGWGIFWKDDSELRALAPVAAFTREAWREKQQDELARALRRHSRSVELLYLVDFDRWRPGVGLAVHQVSEDIRSWHPPVEYGHWGSVPGLWVCDPQAESALTQGVTLGCPDSEYMLALSEAWISLGLVDQVGGIGLVVGELEGMGSAQRAYSGLMLGLGDQLQDLVRLSDRLDIALDNLWRVSVDYDLPLFVEVME